MALILGTGRVVPRPVASRPAPSHPAPSCPHPSRSVFLFVSALSKRTLGRSRTTGGGTVFAPPSCYLLPCRTLAVSFPPLPQILTLHRDAILMPTRGGGRVFAPPKRAQARPSPADHTLNINIGGRGGQTRQQQHALLKQGGPREVVQKLFHHPYVMYMRVSKGQAPHVIYMKARPFVHYI